MKKQQKIILARAIIIITITMILSFVIITINLPPEEITNFEECVAAGNLVMESYPRQCRAGDQLFIEDIRVFCQEEQRNADACIALYDPVCGYFNENIQCVKAPCAAQYSNPCEACKNSDVSYYLRGECPI